VLPVALYLSDLCPEALAGDFLRLHIRARRMSVFPLKFGTALRTIIYPLGDPRGRLGLLEIGLERSQEAG
jgi:hypothetical protein